MVLASDLRLLLAGMRVFRIIRDRSQTFSTNGGRTCHLHVAFTLSGMDNNHSTYWMALSQNRRITIRCTRSRGPRGFGKQ